MTRCLIIATTFAAFSYFSPIFTEVAGFSLEVVPVLLLIYVAATVFSIAHLILKNILTVTFL